MSEFFMQTLHDAAVSLHRTEPEMVELVEEVGGRILNWRWGDGKIYKSINRFWFDLILQTKFSPEERFKACRLDLSAQWDNPPTVSHDALLHHIDLHVYAGSQYSIEASRCDSSKKVIGWIMHLSEKVWFSGALARDFIETCSRVHNLEISYHA